MRIELPSTSWAQAAHRAQDDAHTLTLPTPVAVTLTEAWLAAAEGLEGFRVEVRQAELQVLTLTL
jgi:hypothetical protein